MNLQAPIPGVIGLRGRYRVECVRPDGSIAWVVEGTNLITTAGRNKFLDATLKTGLTAPLWYVGMKDAGTPVAADTMASHASWPTITPYSNATDPAWTPGTIAAGAVDNSAAVAVFTIDTSDEVFGIFLKDNATKGGATGTLLAVADFGSSQPVTAGATVNATYALATTAL